MSPTSEQFHTIISRHLTLHKAVSQVPSFWQWPNPDSCFAPLHPTPWKSEVFSFYIIWRLWHLSTKYLIGYTTLHVSLDIFLSLYSMGMRKSLEKTHTHLQYSEASISCVPIIFKTVMWGIPEPHFCILWIAETCFALIFEPVWYSRRDSGPYFFPLIKNLKLEFKYVSLVHQWGGKRSWGWQADWGSLCSYAISVPERCGEKTAHLLFIWQVNDVTNTFFLTIYRYNCFHSCAMTHWVLVLHLQ